MNHKDNYKNKDKITILANNEGLIQTQQLKNYIFRNYKIVSKSIGIDKSTKNMKDFYIEPYLLDIISTTFLYQEEVELFEIKDISETIKNQLAIIKCSIQFKAFMELKKNFFMINGHKFGSSFLAYDKNPQKNHAKYLIFCSEEDLHEDKNKINHMTRLAEIAKKQCLYINYSQQNQLKFMILKRQKSQNKVKGQQKQVKYTILNIENFDNLC